MSASPAPSTVAEPATQRAFVAPLRLVALWRTSWLAALAGGLTLVEWSALVFVGERWLHPSPAVGFGAAACAWLGTAVAVASVGAPPSAPAHLGRRRPLARALAVAALGLVFAALVASGVASAAHGLAGTHTESLLIHVAITVFGALGAALGWWALRRCDREARALVAAALDAWTVHEAGLPPLEPAPEGPAAWGARYEPVGRGAPLDEAEVSALESSAHATEVAVVWGDELVRVEWPGAGAREIPWPVELAAEGAPRVRLAPMGEGGARAVTLPAACSATLRKGGRGASSTLERGARVELELGDELVIAGPHASAGYRRAAGAEGESFEGAQVTLRVRTERAARRAPRGPVVGARAGVIMLAAFATEAWFGASVARVVPAREAHVLTPYRASIAAGLLARADGEHWLDPWREADLDDTDTKLTKGMSVGSEGDVLVPFASSELVFSNESWDDISDAFSPVFEARCASAMDSRWRDRFPSSGACGAYFRRLGPRGLEGVGDPSAPVVASHVALVDSSDPMLAVRPSPGPRADEGRTPVNVTAPMFALGPGRAGDHVVRALAGRRAGIERCAGRVDALWRPCVAAHVSADDQGRLRARISSPDHYGRVRGRERRACDDAFESPEARRALNLFETCVDAAVYGAQVPPGRGGGAVVWFDAELEAK